MSVILKMLMNVQKSNSPILKGLKKKTKKKMVPKMFKTNRSFFKFQSLYSSKSVDDAQSTDNSAKNTNSERIPNSRTKPWRYTVEGNVASRWRRCAKTTANSSTSKVGTIGLKRRKVILSLGYKSLLGHQTYPDGTGVVGKCAGVWGTRTLTLDRIPEGSRAVGRDW